VDQVGRKHMKPRCDGIVLFSLILCYAFLNL
jgi:hypothetical protein